MANNDWNVKMHVDFDVNFQTAKMCIAMLNIYLADNPGKGIAIYTDGPYGYKFEQIDIQDIDKAKDVTQWTLTHS